MNGSDSVRPETNGGAEPGSEIGVQQPESVPSSEDPTSPVGGQDVPAVGVVPAGETDAVARIVHRATHHELAVFVAVDDTENTTAQIARQLGASVVEVAPEIDTIAERKAVLLQTVRDDSYPGLIVAEGTTAPVAFEASLSDFEASDNRLVEATVDPEQTTVLVGIPAYNEAETVGAVVEAAQPHADEVLVVDDGSTDSTADRAREAGATVIEHDRNRGYGRGLQTIFEAASSRAVEALVVLDGDNQHDTEDIPRLLAEHEASAADIVIGNRFGETASTDIPIYRQGGLWVITSLVNVCLGNVSSADRIQDAQCGFRSYNRAAIESLADNTSLLSDGMSASTDILYHANREGLDTAEIPTSITYDVSNANTRHPITHGLGIVSRILTTAERQRPLTVVGVPGAVLTALGVGVGYWSVSNYTANGAVLADSVVLSVVLLLLGMVSLFVSAVQYSLNASLDERGFQ